MPGEPLAYFLTWNCYGTWLHGDSRWSVDRKHNMFRGSSIAPHAGMERAARSRMKGKTVLLTPTMRRIAEVAIREHARHKGWTDHAVNIRTNHGHAVIAASGANPDVVLAQLKAWATRALREAGEFGSDARIWAARGSKRWLWDEESVRRAVEYVTLEQ